MIPIYLFFTTWTYIFSMLEKITGISFFPGVLISLITSVTMSINSNLSVPLLIVMILCHMLPFAWTSIKCNSSIVVANVLVGFVYLVFLHIYKTTPAQIYQSQMEYLKKQNLKTLYDTNGNICIFC